MHNLSLKRMLNTESLFKNNLYIYKKKKYFKI